MSSSNESLVLLADYLSKRESTEKYISLVALAFENKLDIETLREHLQKLSEIGCFDVSGSDIVIKDRAAILRIADSISKNQAREKSGTFQPVEKVVNTLAKSALEIQNNKRSYPEDRKVREYTRTENNRKRTRPKNNPDLIKQVGNRCGHVPNVQLKFKEPSVRSGTGKRPPVIKLAFHAMKKFDSPDSQAFLPRLNNAQYNNPNSKRKYKKNGHCVKMRTEQTEVIRLVACVLFCFLDLKSMRVGRPKYNKNNHKNGKMSGLKLEEIAEILDISLSRVEEAMSSLVWSGYVKTFARYDKDINKKTGIFVGLGAVRTISKALFEDMRLGKKLRSNVAWAVNKAKETVSHINQDIIDKLILEKQLQMEFVSQTTNESYQSQALSEMKAIVKK